MKLRPSAADQKLEELENKLQEREQRIQSLEKRLSSLEESLRLLRAQKFSSSSEKSPGQGELFDEAEACIAELEELVAEQPTATTKKEKSKPVRKPLPANLPRERIVYELSEAQRQCECGDCKVEIGEDTSEQLEIIPAKLKVIQHVRKKYACNKCENGVLTAPREKSLLPKSNANAATLAYLVTAKYQDGLPLYRLSGILNRHGIDLSRQTLSDWMLKTAEALKPVTAHLQKHILAGELVHMDETRVQVLKEENKTPQSQSYMWVQKGGPPDKPAVIFSYNPSRSGQVAVDLLQGYSGALMVDGYEGYNAVVNNNNLTQLCCMAHMRRKFIEAQKVDPKPKKGEAKKLSKADQVVNLIKQLYAIEQQQKNNSRQQRYEARQLRSVPVITKLKAWLDKHSLTVVPGGALGKAIAYALKYWERLTKYVNDGLWPIDNNAAENAIRPFVIGRKNWLFSNTAKGANASAVLYSLIETAKACGHEPYEYMRWLFVELPKGNKDIEELMPWAISPNSLQGVV